MTDLDKLNEILGDEFDVSAWVKDKANTWISMEGTWGPKPVPMLDNQRLNPMYGEDKRYFQPDGIIVLGPAPVNPEQEAFRLFLSREGQWRGPFTSFADAAAAFAAFQQQETTDEG